MRFQKTLHFLQPVIFDSHVSLARHLVRTWLQTYDGTATQKGRLLRANAIYWVRGEISCSIFISIQNLSRHLIGSLYPVIFTAVIGRTFQISKFKFKFLKKRQKMKPKNYSNNNYIIINIINIIIIPFSYDYHCYSCY